MVEQWYAVHKKTGEFFCHKGRYCFSEKGIVQSVRNEHGIWHWGPDKAILLKCPMEEWEIRKVVLK